VYQEEESEVDYMGDPRRIRKKYITPGHPWQKERLIEELQYMGKYGLRNKHEIWRHRTMLRKYRAVARKLLGLSEKEREKIENEIINRLYRLGILKENSTLDDILGLTVEDILERRLQTQVYRLGLAKTIYQARQLIVHGHIAVGDQIVRVPSYLVPRGVEKTISYAPKSPFANSEHPLRKTLTITPQSEEEENKNE